MFRRARSLKMPDFAAALANAQKNFSKAGIEALDPDFQAKTIAVHEHLHANDIVAPMQKCEGDFFKMPFGWRQSAFMGECGPKIQMKDVYSADSPCYPVQDISCMGAVQKQAWARICKTDFPCKPPTEPELPKPYKAPPGLFGPKTTPVGDFWYAALKIASENSTALFGTCMGACILGVILRAPVTEKDEDIDEAITSDNSKSS